MRTNVYVDGFNFYKGAVESTRYRWLDFSSLASELIPTADIGHVHYFTARVKEIGSQPGGPGRQDVYIKALRSLANTTVHEGSFLKLPGGRFREKGSDVNLATQLMLDVFDGVCSQALVISCDSDLATPLRVAKQRFGIRIVAAFPLGRDSAKIRRVADEVVRIWEKNLASSLFPATLPTGRGELHIPPEWISGARIPPSYRKFLAEKKRRAGNSN